MPESNNAPLIIFGGTFDPVHLGHLRIIEAVCDRLKAAQVVWLPAGQPPHRPTPGASAPQRLAMLELALAHEPRFIIDTRELHRLGPSYTVLSLAELKAEHPERTLCLVLGLDAALALPQWHCWQDVLELANIAVMRRPGWSLPDPLPSWWVSAQRSGGDNPPAYPSTWIKAIEVPAVDISAAQIRADLAAGRPIDQKVPVAIARYIEEHELYE